MSKETLYKVTSDDIELAVAEHFDYRTNIIVPNVAHGFGIHECDLLIMNKTGYASEVEIKISPGDLRRDKSKDHAHADEKIKCLWFAIPESLSNFTRHIPAHAGIITVSKFKSAAYDKVSLRSRIRRHPTPKAGTYRKLTTEEQLAVARLGAMRTWNLRERMWKTNVQLEEEIK